MKDTQKLRNLLAIGLNSHLAEKAISQGYFLTKLKSATKQELSKYFSKEETALLWQSIKRLPISEVTIKRLAEECDWKCCMCWNFRKESPIIIHHIEEHAKTHDDSYENLALLCLEHHAIAHSKWLISQHPCPRPHSFPKSEVDSRGSRFQIRASSRTRN